MKRSVFIILCLEAAVLSFSVAASAALVPSIAAQFALSQFAAGSIIWAYMLPYGVAALIYGPLVRAVDARKVELSCMLLFSTANFLAAGAMSFKALFIARMLMGLFGASVIPLGLILIARHVPQKERGRYVGIFFAASFAASLLGLIASGFLDWRLVYLIPAIAGAILFAVMYTGLPSFKEQSALPKVNYLSALQDRAFLTLFSYIFMISLAYHAVQQWLAVYFSLRLGLTQAIISLLITLTSFSGIFGESFGGVLADKFGRLRTVKLGLALMAASVFALIFGTDLRFLVIIMLMWGFGWTANHAGLSTILCDLPPKYINEGASLNSGIRFVSGGIGVSVGALLMQHSFTLHFATFGIFFIIIGVFAKKILSQSLGGKIHAGT